MPVDMNRVDEMLLLSGLLQPFEVFLHAAVPVVFVAARRLSGLFKRAVVLCELLVQLEHGDEDTIASFGELTSIRHATS